MNGSYTPEGIVERRPSGATHSFRLTPAAYSILEGVPKKSSNHRGRSAWVSEAIIFYGTSTTVKVASAMGNLIYPNMAVASPEQLHAEIIKLQARVSFWVERSNEFQAQVERNESWIKRIIKRRGGSIWGKKTPK